MEVVMLILGFGVVIFNKQIAFGSARSWGKAMTFDSEKGLGPYRVLIVFIGALFISISAARLLGY